MAASYQMPGKSDRVLGLTVFGLVLFGIVAVYSASSVVAALPPFNNPTLFVTRQVLYAGLGIVGMMVAAGIDYKTWQRNAGWMLILTFALLCSVFFFSRGEINGAHRWINLGPINFQPSELAKFTLIAYTSAWLVKQRDHIGTLSVFGVFLAILALISALMLAQPDFGTLVILLVPAIAVYLVAGMNWKQMIFGLVLAAVALGGIAIAAPYRLERVTTFLHPEKDTTGAAYHVKNIEIAVGTGGVTGLGFGNSKQKRRFLPEPYTDSIFAVITEELGFIRATLLAAVLIFVACRGLLIAYAVDEPFGKLMAVGISVWFGFQTIMNLAAMLHLVPLVGVPLPFISYGGTNLVISLSAVGVLLNISKVRREGVEPSFMPNVRKLIPTRKKKR